MTLSISNQSPACSAWTNVPSSHSKPPWVQPSCIWANRSFSRVKSICSFDMSVVDNQRCYDTLLNGLQGSKEGFFLLLLICIYFIFSYKFYITFTLHLHIYICTHTHLLFNTKNKYIKSKFQPILTFSTHSYSNPNVSENQMFKLKGI